MLDGCGGNEAEKREARHWRVDDAHKQGDRGNEVQEAYMDTICCCRTDIAYILQPLKGSPRPAMSSSAGPGEASTSASAVSLGKRTRSASPAGEEEGSSSKRNGNGHAQTNADASDSDDDDVGPMPVPESDDDAEAGPMPAGLGGSTAAATSKAALKKRKVLKYEKVYLDNLPSADRYYSVYQAGLSDRPAPTG